MNTTTLFRPVNKAELDLIQASDWQAFPPRLPGQPIFYPVMNLEYARQITVEWNVPRYGNGFVVAFELSDAYLKQHQVYNVGNRIHDELWVPAEDLPTFNEQIIGDIRVVEGYTDEEGTYYLFLDLIFHLTGRGKHLSVSNLDPDTNWSIHETSTLNGLPLQVYLEQPRALTAQGQIRLDAFILRLQDDSHTDQLQVRSVVVLADG